jgi:signal transduction histidine kinase
MDNGSGMNENQIASIGNFMQFERTKFEQQRAGLGLTISRKLVEFYCGKFKIESVPRKQTIVRITLNRTNNTI